MTVLEEGSEKAEVKGRVGRGLEEARKESNCLGRGERGEGGKGGRGGRGA